jgi:hypothetical protein
MKWKWVVIHVVVIVLILLAAGSPLIAVAIAGSIANANGCELHEGFVNPCVIDGVDRGQDLYTAAMLGWFAIATVPIGLIAALVYLLVVVIVALVRRNRRRTLTASS